MSLYSALSIGVAGLNDNRVLRTRAGRGELRADKREFVHVREAKAVDRAIFEERLAVRARA